VLISNDIISMLTEHVCIGALAEMGVSVTSDQSTTNSVVGDQGPADGSSLRRSVLRGPEVKGGRQAADRQTDR
jgi:hypothetical protein